ncbi:TIGR00153 family protein [Calditrichota bacterium]
MNIMTRMIGGISPFQQLKLHLDKVMECSKLVVPLLEAAFDDDQEKLSSLAKEVFRLEKEADNIKLDLRDNLPKGRMLPVARIDLLAYLKEQDNIADKVEDLAMNLTVRPLAIPSHLCAIDFKETLRALANEAIESANGVAKIFDWILEHKRAAFAGKVADKIRDAASEVGFHEHEADMHQFRLVRCILAIDDPGWKFAESYSLLAVVQSLSKLANHAESMSDYLRLMVAD